MKLNSVILCCISLLLLGCSFESKPLDSFSMSVQGVFSADYSTDGKRALVGSIQHGGSLWDTQNAERIYSWNHSDDTPSQITATAFSPDGNYAATADETTLVLWDTATGEALRFFSVPGEILYLELSPNATTALLAMNNNTAVLFDIQQGGILHSMNQGDRILSMDMSENGKFALFGIDGSIVNYWNLESAKLLWQFESQGRVHTVALSHDGTLGFTAVQHIDAIVWDFSRKTELTTLDYSNPFFPSFSSFVVARFSDDAKTLITGNTTGAVELWQSDDGSLLKRWITPMPKGITPKVFSIQAVAVQSAEQQIVAMNSKGTSFRYAL